MPDEGKKRGGKKDKAEIRKRPGLERVLNGKVAGHILDGEYARLRSMRLSSSFASSGHRPGAITISGRSALTIYERLMRAQGGLLTRTSDSVAEREEFSLTVIPVTFAVVRSGLEELGKMADVMTEAGRNPGEICDVLSAIDWMLRGMLQSLFAVVQRLTKATGLRAKHAKQLERLVEEECDRTFGILAEAVLVRLVRSIFPWMERMFERLEQTVDVPMELVGILEGALNAAEQFGFNGVGASVRERVVLEACQQLRRLPRRIPADGGSKSVRERKQRLAKKEAVWYLGAVLQGNPTTAVSARMGSRLAESARLGMLTIVESEFVFGRGCCGIAEE